MSFVSAIITIRLVNTKESYDIEVPLDISANELCAMLMECYLPEEKANVQQFYLKAERPIALLRGGKSLREYGIRDGSIINIVR